MSQPQAQPLIMLISAPSGAGKTTLCQELLARDSRIGRAITCTTRPPRPGEADGVDYHFLGPAVFARHVEHGAFLEHATVHGNLYGTLKSEVASRIGSGQDVLLNIDVQGAASIRTCASEDPELKKALFSVFLAPPSLAELEARLRKRGQDSEEVIQRRLAGAREELSHWREFDYLVLADTVPDGLSRLQTILAAERMKQKRIALPIV